MYVFVEFGRFLVGILLIVLMFKLMIVIDSEIIINWFLILFCMGLIKVNSILYILVIVYVRLMYDLFFCFIRIRFDVRISF